MTAHWKVVVFLAIVQLAALVASHGGHAGGCAHDRVKMKNVPVLPQSYPFDAQSRQFKELNADGSSYVNMRVKYYFDVDGTGTCKTSGQSISTFSGDTVTCRSQDVATSAKIAYWNRLMTAAAEWISKALRVVPVSGNLRVPSSCGGELKTNGSVPNADFIIYVTAAPDSNPGTLAWAYACAQDSNRRPTASHVNIVPSQYSPGSQLKYDLARQTFIHEIAHALGFSGPFFENGHVNLNWERVTGGSTTAFDSVLGKETTKLTSPRVQRWARNYFGCSTLTGVEIEDQGGAGTGGSHWEKRVVSEEFMVGVESLPRSFMSGLTLAYFEDMGHYRANYEMAEDAEMVWGKNTGCDITNNKCNANKPGTKSHFCVFDKTATNVCMVGRAAIGSCSVSTGNEIPSQFRYFSDPTEGGDTETLDWCPIISQYADAVCIDASLTNDTVSGNTFSPNSRCFTSNLRATSGTPALNTGNSRCHIFSCASDGRLSIRVGSMTAQCPADGSAGTVTFAGYTGSVTCPTSMEMCRKTPGAAATTRVPTTRAPGNTPRPPTAAVMTTRASTARPTTRRSATTLRPTTRRPATPTTRRPATTLRPTTRRPASSPTTRRPATTARPTTRRPASTARPTTRRPVTTLRPTTRRPTTVRASTRRPLTTPEPPVESQSSDFGSSDFGSSDFGSSDFGSSDFGSSDFGSSQMASSETS